MPCVAGVKYCRSGWLIVTVQINGDVISEEHKFCSSLREALCVYPKPAVFAVNIPMGLPQEPVKGGRECDREARKILGRPRGSSVFSPPPRISLECSKLEQGRRHGLSKQAFSVLSGVREMDRIITPERQSWIKEAHPELSFYMMDGLRPVDEKRRTAPGRDARIGLLSRFFHQVEDGLRKFHTKDASPEDVLDAYAVAWTAMRVFRGEAGCVPETAPCDHRGIEMAIWF